MYTYFYHIGALIFFFIGVAIVFDQYGFDTDKKNVKMAYYVCVILCFLLFILF